MIKRSCQFVLLVAVAAVSTLAGGCGDDEVILVPPSGPITIPIRQGTWSIQEVATYTGADSCVARDSTTVDTTDILCSFDIGDTPSPLFLTDCEVDTVEGQVVFDCTIRANLGICLQLIHITGSGTVTDTTFDLSSVLTTRLEPSEGVTDSVCNAFYGNFVDACTTMIESQGAFLYWQAIAGIEPDSAKCHRMGFTDSMGVTVFPCTTWACTGKEPPDSTGTLGFQDFLRQRGGVDLWRR